MGLGQASSSVVCGSFDMELFFLRRGVSPGVQSECSHCGLVASKSLGKRRRDEGICFQMWKNNATFWNMILFQKDEPYEKNNSILIAPVVS